MPTGPKVVYRVHATLRMAERGVSRLEVEQTLGVGETIEGYPDDKPYPSRLLLATINGRPLHVVAAWNEGDQEWIVIMVYEPDPKDWTPIKIRGNPVARVFKD